MSHNALAALLGVCIDVQTLRNRYLVHLQLDDVIAPKLSIFGEEPQNFQGTLSEGNMQIWLAQTIPFLRQLEEIADILKAFLENLLIQLGSLCAEHTRKSTILQGEASNFPTLCHASLHAVLFISCVTISQPREYPKPNCTGLGIFDSIRTASSRDMYLVSSLLLSFCT